MDGKRIGSIGLTIVFVVLIFWWRSSERSDDSKEVKAVAMAMVDSIDVNNTDKAVLKTMAEYAHTSAFDDAYRGATRRRSAQFDEELYFISFFESMMSQAEMRGRQDLKKALLKLQSGAEEETPVEETPPESGAESDVAQASEGDAADSSEGTTVADADLPKSDGRLSRAEFDALGDDRIEEELFNRISMKVDATGEKTAAAVKKLSKGERMVYVTWIVESEVNNGGFEQFFTNSSGRLTKSAVPAFALIGAKKHATLMRRAIAAYSRANPKQSIFKVDKTVKGYQKKYKDKSLGPVDDAFMDLDLGKLRLDYIRKNAKQFVAEE